MSLSHGSFSEPKMFGWRLVGTDRYWPAMFGPPPEMCGLRWEAMYR